MKTYDDITECPECGEKLKPCPACGSPAMPITYVNMVFCSDFACDFQTDMGAPIGKENRTEHTDVCYSIGQWNRRPLEKKPPDGRIHVDGKGVSEG